MSLTVTPRQAPFMRALRKGMTKRHHAVVVVVVVAVAVDVAMAVENHPPLALPALAHRGAQPQIDPAMGA